MIGAGIAGAAVATRLGRAGLSVHLIEKERVIGGRARETGCKATDTCRRCNACVADEILRNVGAVPNVRVCTGTELLALQAGNNGSRFTALLGPSCCASEEAVEDTSAGAVYGGGVQLSGETTVDVDAVVVAIGYEPYDPKENPAYGYRAIANVMTGIDAERVLAAKHRLVRPSDGEQPQRVAFVQCVGSRSEEIYRRPEDTDYCSTVCCAYALRMARQLKYQAEDAEITVFYMDVQNFGKGFNQFYSECRSVMRFVRSRPYEIRASADGAVRVKYTPDSGVAEGDGCVCEEEFDLLILAVGIRPPRDARALADKLGVALDDQGFFGLKGVAALPDLQRSGVFVAGAGESPKDMAGCIAQADAVSARILSEV